MPHFCRLICQAAQVSAAGTHSQVSGHWACRELATAVLGRAHEPGIQPFHVHHMQAILQGLLHAVLLHVAGHHMCDALISEVVGHSAAQALCRAGTGIMQWDSRVSVLCGRQLEASRACSANARLRPGVAASKISIYRPTPCMQHAAEGLHIGAALNYGCSWRPSRLKNGCLRPGGFCAGLRPG